MIPDELKRMKPLGKGERLGQNRDSEYLGAEDIDPGKEPVLTIAAIYNGMVTLQRGKENKDVITFTEDKVKGIRNVRPLIVNATNRKTLRKLYGSVAVEVLVGKKIQLYIDHKVRDPSSGDLIDGIRIRPRVPQVEKKTFICPDCNKEITAVGKYSPQDIAQINMRRFGRPICGACSKKLGEEEKEKQTEEPAEVTEQPNESAEVEKAVEELPE